MHTFPLHEIAVIKRRRHGISRGGSQAASVPTSVVVNPGVFSLSPTGTLQLVATVFDQFGAPMPGESVTWSSGTPAVATVDATGLVTAVAVGSATITATDGLISGSANCTVAASTTWHIATNGTAGGAGTSASPWDYVTGFGKATTVQPGDSVVIHGGDYGTGVETVTLSLAGSATQPIIIRPAPGEMFAINIKQVDVTGHDLWLWNDDHFNAELHCAVASPDGTDLTRFQDAGTLKCINWVVHDGGGIGLAPQSETADHEMNGNILYNNGRSATLAPVYGHGIYSHGTTTAGQKRKIRGNILFNQVGYGIHSFADTGNEDNFEVYWNFSAGNGLGNGYDMLIGGQTALTNCDVEHNACKNLLHQQTATIGYLADGDPGALGIGGLCQRNYFSGLVALGNWDNAGFQFLRNTIVEGDAGLLLRWKFQGASIAMAGNLSDYNQYASLQSGGIFAASYINPAQNVDGTYSTLAALKTALGGTNDQHSTLTNAANFGTQVFESVNEYVSGRAHYLIDNPSGAATVAVDISSVVAVGETYEVWNVYDLKTQTNPTGAAVLSGTYAGGTVAFPMTGKTPKALAGNEFPPNNGLPNTGLFVVLRTSGTTAPAMTSTPGSLTFSATAGGSDPAVQTPTITSSPVAMGLAVSVGYTSGNGWLAVSLDQDRTKATLTVTPTTGALAAGTYNATITITSSNAPTITIPVTFTVNAAGGDPTGFDTLQTALGGAAHVQAAYERRQHWSATSITDCRFSGGTGPALSPTGTPTLDGSSNLVFAAGDDMHSAANAMFALTTAGSLLLTAAIEADGTNAAGLAPTAGAAVLIIAEGATGKIGVWSDHETDTTVAESATLRPVIITWDGINSGTVQVGNNTPVAFTASANFAAGNGVLTLGGFFTASGTNGGCVIAGVIKVDHQVNSTEASAFITYSTGQLGATA